MIELKTGEEFTKEELAVFNEQYLAMFKNLAEMKKQKDALDKQEKDIKSKLEAAMDEYSIQKIENEYITITRVAENPGKQTVDLDKMQKEEPELFNELLADYPKTTGKKKGYVMFKVK
jgi:regulator of replication initiation timing